MFINWHKGTECIGYVYSHPPIYVVCLQTQYIKPSAKLRKHDAEDTSIYRNIKLPRQN
jgi:hypothetical protein